MSCGSDNPNSPDFSGDDEINEIMTALSAFNVPGAAIAIIKDFKIDTLFTFGVMDNNTKEPVTEETLFQVASISKPVSALASMQFVQDGKISLNEDVNNKLLSWKVPENQFTSIQKVTLKRLLSHTAGINQGGKVGIPRNQNVSTLLQILNGEPQSLYFLVAPENVPGSTFIYSNEGFSVIQQLLIDLSGKTFPDLMKEIVLDPLEMNSSTFELYLPQEFENRAASGHWSNGEVLEGKYQIHPKLAAAGLWTTAEDLTKFLIEFLLSLNGLSNKILSREMTMEMAEPVTSFEDGRKYSLGIGIREINGITYYWHSGGFDGFNALMYGNEVAGTGFVLLTNYCPDMCKDLILNLIAHYLNWPGFESI